jgi:hypothetical protein
VSHQACLYDPDDDVTYAPCRCPACGIALGAAVLAGPAEGRNVAYPYRRGHVLLDSRVFMP